MTKPTNMGYYDDEILKSQYLKFKTVWFYRTIAFDVGGKSEVCIPVDYLMWILTEDENPKVRTAFIDKFENVKGFLGNKEIKRRLKTLPELSKELEILSTRNLHTGE